MKQLAMAPPIRCRTNGRVLQRKCACGTHTIGGGMCDKCRIQKVSSNAPGDAFEQEAEEMARQFSPDDTFAPVHAPGRNGPLPRDTRTFYESRFGHDYVAYKPKNATPAKAVDALVQSLRNWEIDCALYPEIARLHAYRHARGRDRFNTRFKDLKLRAHESTGIEEKFYEVKSTPTAEFNKLWDESPVGTKVMWTNRRSITVGTAWHNENAIKSVKGATPEGDRCDAKGVRARKKSEAYIKRGLAESAGDFPANQDESKKQQHVDQNIYRSQLHLLKRPPAEDRK